MRIVIAEDDENSRILLESILVSLGHTVVATSDGTAALRAVEAEPTDLLITGILMPGMDGFDLCRKVRHGKHSRHVPIIVYSATYIDHRDEEMALAAGANRFLVKPVEPMRMVAIVEEVAREGVGEIQSPYSEQALDQLHVERLQAKLRRKLIQLGRETQALRNSEVRLRLALDAAAQGIFEWHLDSDVVSYDERTNELLFSSRTPGSSSGVQFINAAHPDDRAKLAGAPLRLLQPAANIGLLCRFNTPSQGTRWVEIHMRRASNEKFSSGSRVVGVMRDITDMGSTSEHLKKSASEQDYATWHDPLTRLPNRLKFNTLLDTTLSQCERAGVLLLDLDAFKVINDSLGHSAGDTLLGIVAERLEEACPEQTSLSRVGSDEFAIIVESPDDGDQLAQLARSLLVAVSQPITLHNETVKISASIGISHSPTDGIDRNTLFRAADTALFSAKESGRNHFSFHNPDMTHRAHELHSIDQGLKRALELNHLRVHYQPQVELATGRIIGLEALLRWEHPTKGMIPPGRFIPVAETTGLIEQIGRWVLRSACAECADWCRNESDPVKLSVNVSARQLVDENFVEILKAVIEETGFPPDCLELELTESTLQLVETSPALLDQIKQLGICIAIDDFGTGYSSLSVLKKLPIDCLKIDQSFVRDIPGDASDVAIVAAIIGISQTLGLTVVAEGVETEAQQQALLGLSCHIGQGYHYSRPLPMPALQNWLAERSA